MRLKPVRKTASLGMLWLAALTCVSGVSTAANAADAASADLGQVKRFVSCPVYRDTDAGRKSGCWLATEHETGQRFDLSLSQNKPYIGRQLLVEGVVSAGKDVCGGVVLEPVRVSVLADSCPELIIPAEGHVSRPSGLPAELVQPLSVPRKLPPPPYERRDFHVIFDFGDDFLSYQQSDVVLERIWLYATAAKAASVQITGYADTAGFALSGRHLAEPAGLARQRAENVAEALRRLGVPATNLRLSTDLKPRAVLDTPAMDLVSKRRVTVIVTP